MPDDLDVVQHPTLGELKFPKSMNFDDRNKSIEKLENQSDPQKTISLVSAAGGNGANLAPLTLPRVGDSTWGEDPAHKSALQTSLEDVRGGNYKRAAHDIVSGLGQGLMPASLALGWEAPAATALALGGGLGLQKGAEATYDKFGGRNPDTRNLVGDAGAVTGSVAGGLANDLLPTPLKNMSVGDIPGEIGRLMRTPGKINPDTGIPMPGTLRAGIRRLPFVGSVADAVVPANPNPIGYKMPIPGRVSIPADPMGNMETTESALTGGGDDLISRTRALVKPGVQPTASDLKRAGDLTQAPLTRLQQLAKFGDELAKNEINRRLKNP